MHTYTMWPDWGLVRSIAVMHVYGAPATLVTAILADGRVYRCRTRDKRAASLAHYGGWGGARPADGPALVLACLTACQRCGLSRLAGVPL